MKEVFDRTVYGKDQDPIDMNTGLPIDWADADEHLRRVVMDESAVSADEQEQSYIRWMYDPDNEGRCESCPENHGFDSWGGNLPCGQQNCWVTCHCSR